MKKPRVALVCTGVDFVNRGFERATRDLFEQLGGQADVTLFKGGGRPALRETRLRVPRRTGPHARAIGWQRAYELEVLLFATRLYPRVRGRYDVVHYFEPYLGNVLAAARRRFGGRYALLLTDALGLTRESSSGADLVQTTTPGGRDLLLSEGRPGDEVDFIPLGINTRRYAATASKAEARQALGLPLDRRVLVAISAVNRRHKRVDTLVEEVAQLQDGSILLLSGALEEIELLVEARNRLGDRFEFADVPSDQVPLLHAAADVFVHAALDEGYGLAIIEAMAAGLPVVTHRSPHFEWLVGDTRQLVDFRLPGALAQGLASMPGDARERNLARAHELDWGTLVPSYIDLYERVAHRFARPA